MISKPLIALNRSGSGRSILTDGTRTFSYSECAELIRSVMADLRKEGVGQSDCLDFRCDHSLASALLWLALLEGGWSFFVSAVSMCLQNPHAPVFCKFSVNGHWNGGQLLLEVARNPAWNGSTHSSEAGMQTIYFQTSGTAGNPKLVAHSGVNLLRNASNAAHRLELKDSDRIVIPVPLYHLYGLGAAFLPGALTGASMEIQPGSNLISFVSREKEFHPNIAFLTPGFMETLAKGRRSPRRYDLTVTAGDLLKHDVFDRYEERFGTVVSLYGSTELGVIAAASRHDSCEVRAQTVGRPMEGVACRIEGAEDRGQLLCQHRSGFIGYAGEDGVVSLRDADEWHPTRDLAELAGDDCLRLMGRLDHSANRDGVLVALGDVERSIELISQVASAKVVVAGDSARGRGIVAFCVLTKDAEIDAEGVRKACFTQMRRGHVPDRVEIVESFPLLPSGKPDRPALARMAEETTR